MKRDHYDINGVNITIVDKEMMNKYNLYPWTEHIRVVSESEEIYMYNDDIDRGDLYKAAGYNRSKIDFATPLGWYTRLENKDRFVKEGAVWSYEKHTHGAPVWDSEAWARLDLLILMKVREERAEQEAQ